eukprot:scaffold92523_cov75-Phaeocystis_antarctica.AAC.1
MAVTPCAPRRQRAEFILHTGAAQPRDGVANAEFYDLRPQADEGRPAPSEKQLGRGSKRAWHVLTWPNGHRALDDHIEREVEHHGARRCARVAQPGRQASLPAGVLGREEGAVEDGVAQACAVEPPECSSRAKDGRTSRTRHTALHLRPLRGRGAQASDVATACGANSNRTVSGHP